MGTSVRDLTLSVWSSPLVLAGKSVSGVTQPIWTATDLSLLSIPLTWHKRLHMEQYPPSLERKQDHQTWVGTYSRWNSDTPRWSTSRGLSSTLTILTPIPWAWRYWYAYILLGEYDEQGNEIVGYEGINFQNNQDLDYLKYEGSIDPTIVGGFDNTFRYKDFSLSLYFTYRLVAWYACPMTSPLGIRPIYHATRDAQ